MSPSRFLLSAVAALGILSTAVLSASVRSYLSSTRIFSIDGDRYSISPAPGDEIAHIRAELGRRGVELPAGTGDGPAAVHPLLSFALQAAGRSGPARQYPLPPEFEVDHALALESDEGAVEIAFGRCRMTRAESAGRLKARGWNIRMHAGPRERSASVATYDSGKEKILAFLEEEGGGFLLLRRMEP